MSQLFINNIPAIGTKGIYTLNAPFSTDVGEILECTGVRTISAYIANNDDPYKEVYEAAGLSEDIYEADLNRNAQIVTLENNKGYRYLVPGQYIASYPVQDGVYFRPLTITVALPLLPVERDISFLLTEIRDLVMARLGVPSSTSLVEMTEPRAYTRTIADNVAIERELAASDTGTPDARIAHLQNIITDLTTYNQQLEAYILANP